MLPDSLPDIATLEETADYLRKDVRFVRRLAAQQRIGYLKQGRTLTFPREAVEAYVAANVTAPTPPNPHGLTAASLKRVRT